MRRLIFLSTFACIVISSTIVFFQRQNTLNPGVIPTIYPPSEQVKIKVQAQKKRPMKVFQQIDAVHDGTREQYQVAHDGKMHILNKKTHMQNQQRPQNIDDLVNRKKKKS